MGNRARKATRSDGEATRRNILREAEKLFAFGGFDGVSVRQITNAAGVELSLAHYYFENKEKLFHAVLLMRADEITAQRIKLIDAIESSDDKVASLRALIDAFCTPFADPGSDSEDGLTYYRRLVALVANSERWQSMVFEQNYDPLIHHVAERIADILPEKSKADIYWALSFFLGALANAFAETRRVDRLSDGLCDSTDLNTIKDKLIDFTVGGLLRVGDK